MTMTNPFLALPLLPLVFQLNFKDEYFFNREFCSGYASLIILPVSMNPVELGKGHGKWKEASHSVSRID